MTGLYAIVSRRRQEQLSRRRNGYQQYVLDGVYGYVREDHNSEFLGKRQGDHLQMSSQWLADVRAVADDPAATYFFVDAKNRESVCDAIRRGIALPVSHATTSSLLVDAERRLAAVTTAAPAVPRTSPGISPGPGG